MFEQVFGKFPGFIPVDEDLGGTFDTNISKGTASIIRAEGVMAQ